jgi:methionine synthase II (cobalamin-independent)
MTRRAAPTAVATGVGSLPGEDIDRSAALAFDELPDLPHLPELPARGPGSDLIGRTATQLVDLAVDLQPSGWRLVARPGFDVTRGRELLQRDLDALLPVAGPGYDGRLKVQLAGPWTLAAALELPRGGPAVGDRGAVRDIAESLAETVRTHLADVSRRVPGAELVLQLDEPSLPLVLAGKVPTASGLGVVAPVDPVDIRSVLADVVAGVDDTIPVVVHCCADDVPLGLLAATGAGAVGLDVTDRRRLDLDATGELVEAGTALWLGVLPPLGPGAIPSAHEVAEPVRRLWRDLGFAPELLPERVALTPACGLAGASGGWARSAYRLLAQAARVLAEAPEGTRR